MMNLIIITMGKITSLFRISLWVLTGPEDPWLHPPKRNEAIRHGGWGELYLKSEKKNQRCIQRMQDKVSEVRNEKKERGREVKSM